MPRRALSAAAGSALHSKVMKLEIEISDAQHVRLQEQAKRLGLHPHELARAAVVDLLGERDDDFESAIEVVLTKNAELYERLS